MWFYIQSSIGGAALCHQAGAELFDNTRIRRGLVRDRSYLQAPSNHDDVVSYQSMNAIRIYLYASAALFPPADVIQEEIRSSFIYLN